MINTIINTDCLTGLKQLPDNYVNCIVTSPPYYGLRDYGHPDQIGLEETPEQYINKMVMVFDECRRVLKTDGTLWLNTGDTYAGYWGQKYGQGQSLSGNRENNGSTTPCKKSPLFSKSKRNVQRYGSGNIPAGNGIKPKDLFGIPWMMAFALRSAGWYLRQDIIWHKPNPMPESVTDRCTKSHEYIFLLSKSPKYYYDAVAIMQDAKNPEDDYRRKMQQNDGNKSMPDEKKNGIRPKSWNGSSFDNGKTGEMKHTRGGRKSGNKERKPGSERGCPEGTGSNVCGSVPWEGIKANKRSVWTVTTKPFKEAHFATFPEDLIVDCIKAGCPEGGIVLDPFMGAGTTAVVAKKLLRNYIGFELNPDYLKITDKRLYSEFGLFIK